MRKHKYRIYIKSLNTIEDVKRLIFGDRTETIGQVVEVETYNGDKYFYLDKLEEVKLLEWTGFKDNTEKELYEGDVVKSFDDNNYVITFSDGSFWFDLGNGASVMCCKNRISRDELQKIGDKYTNPELLK